MAQIDALEKLASTGLLKHEPPGREGDRRTRSQRAIRLDDACKTTNAPESRFDLAYNAAHPPGVAALRIHRLSDGQTVPRLSGAAAHSGCRSRDMAASRSLSPRTERNRVRGTRLHRRHLTGLIDAALDLLARVRTLAEAQGFSDR